jgi:hypothetical protein
MRSRFHFEHGGQPVRETQSLLNRIEDWLLLRLTEPRAEMKASNTHATFRTFAGLSPARNPADAGFNRLEAYST